MPRLLSVSRAPKHPVRVDAVVGRTVADHMKEAESPESAAGGEPDSRPPERPVPDFELELRAQLDLVQARLEGEQDHLAQVERVVSDYLPPRHLRLVR